MAAADDADAFARYMLTETRVAAAIRAGTPRDAIAEWCTETLAGGVAGRPREVVFRGVYRVSVGRGLTAR